MKNLLFAISSIIFFRGLSTLVFLSQSFNWLKKNQKKPKGLSPKNSLNLYVLIPVLREQKIIIQTLDYFVDKFKTFSNLKVVVITTQREFDKKIVGPSTNEMVGKYIKENKLDSFISVLDYPNSKGVMAHQLNFAIDQIDDDNSFIVVYNADSQPHPNTFIGFFSLLIRYPKLKVAQQSAVFLNNFQEIGGGIKGMFLQTLAILQSRWTLTHEIPRLLRQSIYKNKFLKKYANAHCVGHGLFVKTSTIKKMGGFPTENITEDLFLGYLIKSKGLHIYPLPQLELANSPKSIKGNWNQKFVWFWGPMKYFNYLRHVFKFRHKLKITNLFSSTLFTVQGFVSALAWLTSGSLVLTALISPIFTDSLPIILFAYLSVIIYGPLQYYLVYKNFPEIFSYAGFHHKTIGFLPLILVSLFSIPVIIFHSLPPFFSLMAEFKKNVFGSIIYKPKTDD